MTKPKAQGANEVTVEQLQVELSKMTQTLSNVLAKNEQLSKENEIFKQKNPIVGVRWYGMGSYHIRMLNPTEGQSSLRLDKYLDKGFLDYATWVNIRKNELARKGLIVRDDSVIEELGLTHQLVAQPDEYKDPNAFTLAELQELLKGPIKNLKNALNKMTSHQAIEHFMLQYKELGLNDAAKKLLLKNRENYLALKYNWNLQHDYDIEMACKTRDISGYENMYRDEIIDMLIEQDLITED